MQLPGRGEVRVFCKATGRNSSSEIGDFYCPTHVKTFKCMEKVPGRAWVEGFFPLAGGRESVWNGDSGN